MSSLYRIHHTDTPPALLGDWNGRIWAAADTLNVDRFHPRSNDAVRPRTRARALYDDQHLYVIFRVEDHHVRSTRLAYQSHVCRDSCVEFFVAPAGLERGYFNFEINAGGTMLLYHIRDAAPGSQSGFRKSRRVPASLGRTVRIYHSLPRRVTPEITKPTTWTIEYAIPFVLFSRYVGPINADAGARWRANFYKCGDKTSNPHWASWAPIGEQCAFHQPDRFGSIEFA